MADNRTLQEFVHAFNAAWVRLHEEEIGDTAEQGPRSDEARSRAS